MDTNEEHAMKFIQKGWGYEKWIYNSSLYCGKLLFFDKGKRCSFHYHKEKHETFYLQSGRIVLYVKPLDELLPLLVAEAAHDGMYPGSGLIDMCERVELNPGDRYVLPPFTVHQMFAEEDSELFEFSTEHFDSDSYRLQKGD